VPLGDRRAARSQPLARADRSPGGGATSRSARSPISSGESGCVRLERDLVTGEGAGDVACDGRGRAARAGAGRGRRRARRSGAASPGRSRAAGRSRCERRLQQRELGAIAGRDDAVRLRVFLLSVERRVEVGATREDQPVEAVERLVHARRSRAGRAAGGHRRARRRARSRRERVPTRVAPRPRTTPWSDRS
jgi:hypothetical protein